VRRLGDSQLTQRRLLSDRSAAILQTFGHCRLRRVTLRNTDPIIRLLGFSSGIGCSRSQSSCAEGNRTSQGASFRCNSSAGARNIKENIMSIRTLRRAGAVAGALSVLTAASLGVAPGASAADPWGNSHPQLCSKVSFGESDNWFEGTYYEFEGTYQRWSGASLITYHKWHATRTYYFWDGSSQVVEGDFSEGCAG
jgi:hypothetical protein